MVTPIRPQCYTCGYYDRATGFCTKLGVRVSDPLMPPCTYSSLPDETETRVYTAEDTTIVLPLPQQRVSVCGLLKSAISRVAKLPSRLSRSANYQESLKQIRDQAALFAASVHTTMTWGLSQAREILRRVKNALTDYYSLPKLGVAVFWAGLTMALLGLGVSMDPLVLLGGLFAACGLGIWLAVAILRALVSQSLH